MGVLKSWKKPVKINCNPSIGDQIFLNPPKSKYALVIFSNPPKSSWKLVHCKSDVFSLVLGLCAEISGRAPPKGKPRTANGLGRRWRLGIDTVGFDASPVPRSHLSTFARCRHRTVRQQNARSVPFSITEILFLNFVRTSRRSLVPIGVIIVLLYLATLQFTKLLTNLNNLSLIYQIALQFPKPLTNLPNQSPFT